MTPSGLQDLFAPVGAVAIKKIFGAHGIYYRGMIIACYIRDQLFLKTDASTESAFIAAGGQPWTYEHASGGKQIKMPYCTLPESAFDDEDEFKRWCKLALESAARAESAKKLKTVKPKAAKPASKLPL